MHIVHFASEIAPIAKVGGLGDVIHGLSKELVRHGHTVDIILPKYDTIRYDLLKHLKVYYRDLWSFDGPYRYNNTIWSAEVDGLNVFLVEPHHPRYFFNRGSVYGSHDDIDRFLYFSRAAMEFLFKSGITADIIHCHDWPTSIVPILLKDMYLSLGMKKAKTVLTLHNLEHQGRCSPSNLTQIGLWGEDYLIPDRCQDPIHPLAINLLKGGIEYCDLLTTVSPSYEKEIKTPHGSHGLLKAILRNQKKLRGILNGIDEDCWNPEKDPHLAARYKAHPPFSDLEIKNIDEKKKENKKKVRKLLGLSEKNCPLVACVSRLVPQKSPFLIAETFNYVLEKGGQCIILGSPDSGEMFELFTSLKNRSSTEEGAIILDYNEELSHLIYAAADMIVIPSLFEPCGLTQMIGLRYGTVPIVRKTGGLKDTVFDINENSIPLEKRNGFSFESLEKEDLFKTLDRAFNLWEKHPSKWASLRTKGMEVDYSWKKAAQEYLSFYKKGP